MFVLNISKSKQNEKNIGYGSEKLLQNNFKNQRLQNAD